MGVSSRSQHGSCLRAYEWYRSHYGSKELCRAKGQEMSGVVWEGNRLFQRVGGRRAELGYIRHDGERGKFVLMLNGESLGLPSNWYLSGDEWNTIREAKEKAAGSAVASLAHTIWRDRDDERSVYIKVIFVILENPSLQQSPEDIEKSKPLSKMLR